MVAIADQAAEEGEQELCLFVVVIALEGLQV